MERFGNQNLLIDQNKLAELRFVVIGAGAIGSGLVVNLCKMGAKLITVYDDDTLEEHNFDSQMYPYSGLGRYKTDVLAEVALQYGQTVITTVKGRWDTEHAIEGDVICVCVDNMDVRKTIWQHYFNKGIKFFLEGRMSAQVYRVYGVDMNNKDAVLFYPTTLYPQSEASLEPCGEKSIIYTVLHVSSQMCSQVKRWIMNDYRPTEVQYDCYVDNVVTTYHQQLLVEDNMDEVVKTYHEEIKCGDNDEGSGEVVQNLQEVRTETQEGR